MSEPFLGQISIMAFGFPPKGWAQCNGQLLPINQNQALFALLGTTYGATDKLPSRCRTCRGVLRSTADRVPVLPHSKVSRVELSQ